MHDISFDSNTTSQTPDFHGDEMLCSICGNSVEFGQLRIICNTPYNTKLLSQICYTVCKDRNFYACGVCVLDQADKKLEELRSILKLRIEFNKELKLLRNFQKSHTCIRSNYQKLYKLDKTLDNFSYKLYMNSVPECLECESREQVLDKIRGPWRGFLFISLRSITNKISRTQIIRNNFKWVKSVHNLHDMICSCKGYSREVYISNTHHHTSD